MTSSEKLFVPFSTVPDGLNSVDIHSTCWLTQGLLLSQEDKLLSPALSYILPLFQILGMSHVKSHPIFVSLYTCQYCKHQACFCSAAW